MPSFPPTPEQQAILDAYRASQTSLMIRAYAGCAKTTTLEFISEIIDPALPTAMLAFNVNIKKELEKRMPSNIKVMTLNGLGHRAWGGVVRGLRLEERKTGQIVSEWLKADGNQSREDWEIIRGITEEATQVGLVPKQWPHARGLVPDEPENWERISAEYLPTDRHIAAAQWCLNKSIEMAYQGIINFNDQVYMSACFGGAFPGFELVMIDEAQDLSPLNHVMLRKTARKRLIVVGDPKQAIYAFRGADATSMDKIKLLRPEWIDLPLATTFRCPVAAVERARPHAPGFTAAPGNKPGTITSFPLRTPDKATWDWTWDDVRTIAKDGTTAILCRNNAPLLAMAFKLIKQKISCRMLGRDIGKGLVTLAKKILPLPLIPRDDCIVQIRNWMTSEMSLAELNGQDNKKNSIQDKGDCLLAVLENSNVQNAGELIQAIQEIFDANYASVTLATGHKAKGLEWDTVVHLDPWRIRSSQVPVENDQEANLRYVIETRMKEHLILAKLEDFNDD